MCIAINTYTPFFVFIILTFSALFCPTPIIAKSNNAAKLHKHYHQQNIHTTHPSYAQFIPNLGQWNNNFAFKAPLGSGNTLFIEKNAFTYMLSHPSDVAAAHDWKQLPHQERKKQKIRTHAYKLQFVGSNKTVAINGLNKHDYYHNYFLGNDEKNWQSEVAVYNSVVYSNLYQGIDLNVYKKDGNLKYDFRVCPKAAPNLIQLSYEGYENIKLENGNLRIALSFTEVMEMKPYAYQIIEGKTIVVACNYVLQNNKVSFDFPDGYNTAYDLIIDPIVLAATLTGTTVTTYGHCAAYDYELNVYAGGIAFGSGYPVTMGAYDVSFEGSVDIAISKYTPDGSDLLYATYIGGASWDNPISLIPDSGNNMYIYGSSSSSNFPTTSAAFQTTFGGATDAIISQLSANGSTLLASTFVGGAQTDGEDYAMSWYYGDSYRGEVFLDASNNVYVSTSTTSSDFPVTAGAAISTIDFSVTQAGAAMQLSSDLSNMVWCSYITGSSGTTNSTGIRVADDGSVYAVGGTTSTDFPVSGGAVQATSSGATDGYVVHFSADGSQILHATYWGNNNDERNYFVDLDSENNVHVFGIGEGGNMPITPDTYAVPNSRPFISSFSSDLSMLRYSTLIGSGSSFIDLIPVAFMVDDCNRIFISGHNATFAALPLTDDAVLTSGGFYVAVFEPDASDLLFATRYSANHVDGGTSRFHPSGIIYQGVCSGGGFVTTPDAWATTQSVSWDVGVFVIDIEVSLDVIVDATPFSECNTNIIDFVLESNIPISDLIWDFGDGTTSSELNPSHEYDNYGTYDVLIQAITEYCEVEEEAIIEVEVLPPPVQNSITEVNLCDQSSYEAVPQTLGYYNWSTGGGSYTNTITESGIYYVDVTTFEGCEVRDSFVVNFSNSQYENLLYEACLGDGISVGNNFVYSGETISYTHTNQAGCDSVVTVEVLTLPSVTRIETLYTCEGSTANFDGTTLAIGSTQDFTYAAVNGCDSIVTVNVLPLNTTFSSFSLTACEGTTVNFEGSTLAVGDVQDFSFTASNGCDSIVTVTVAPINSFTSNQTLYTCDNQSIAFEGNNLMPGETATHTYLTPAGCDSIVTVTVAPLATFNIIETVQICENETYNFEGNNLMVGQSASHTYATASGCDSTVTLMVEPIIVYNTSETLYTCANEALSFEGNSLSVGDTYTHVYTAANGCDSTVNVFIEPIEVFDVQQTVYVCQDESYLFEGISLQPGDEQTFTLNSTLGCDSFIQVSVIAYAPINEFTTLEACENTATFFEGTTLNPGDIQTFTYTAANGCDSLLTVSVESTPTFTTATTFSTCEGTTLSIDGITLAVGDVQDFSYTAANGCDSIATITVAALPVIETSQTYFTCDNQAFVFDDVSLMAGETQNFSYTGIEGCDSIVTVVVNPYPTYSITQNYSACTGETITINGTAVMAGNTQIFNLTTSSGCDSLVTVVVAELPIYDEATTLFTCDNSSTFVDDTELFPGEVQTFTYATTAGCDSSVTFTIEGWETYNLTEMPATCLGDSVLFDGSWLQAGSSEIFPYITTQGCDSIITVEVIAHEVYELTETLSICDNTSTFFDGVELLPEQTEIFTYTTVQGCDSIITVNIDGLSTFETFHTFEACENETYLVDGISIDAGNEEVITYASINGCDSIANVFITALPIHDELIEVDICPDDTHITNGVEMPPNTEQTFYLINQYGCDSIVTVSVAAPESLYFVPEIGANPCDNNADGQINITAAAGGTPPYQYSIDGISYQSMPNFNQVLAGNYTLFMKDSQQCIFQQTIALTQNNSFNVDVFENINTCQNIPTVLIPNIDDFDNNADINYTWQDGSTSDVYNTSNVGTYTVTAFDGCNTIRTHFTLGPDEETLEKAPFLVMTAFSPNGDGINDIFGGIPTIPTENIIYFQLMVYDRWGNQLFTSHNHQQSWNGLFNTTESLVGVYVWQLKVEFVNCAGELQNKLQKGNLTLIR